MAKLIDGKTISKEVREQVAKETAAGSTGEKPVTRKTTKKVGRNQPCPCGSGKKYKNCCGKGEV